MVKYCKKINISTYVKIVVLLTASLLCTASLARSQAEVLFINPGQATESFWHDVDLFMQEAAKQLDLNLMTYHAERNPYLMIKKVKELISNNQLPDYLVLVNEDNAALRMLHLLQGKPVKIIMLLNDIDEQDKGRMFNHPNGPFLLSSIIPDNYTIGYETAAQLVKSGESMPSHSAQILLLSGNKNTPASNQRELGARQLITLHGKTQLLQVVYANWNEQLAYEKSKLLLQRYEQLCYIWAANDQMAFGAIRAARELGKQPGKDIFVSAVNTSEQVLLARQAGTISSLGGGHFMAGGWSMVLIHDDQHGKTIPDKIQQAMFQMIEPKSTLFNLLLAKEWQKLNFAQFTQDSKGNYSFTIK